MNDFEQILMKFFLNTCNRALFIVNLRYNSRQHNKHLLILISNFNTTMWLTSSSIGRKLVMAITGICLVLFVTFHCLMNAIAIVYPSAYNVICEFLGANWYALVASIGAVGNYL